MSKYKVGDRVRVLAQACYSFTGAVGTVCYVDVDAGFGVRLDEPYVTEFGSTIGTEPDEDGWWMCADDEVELLDVPKPTTSPLYVFSDIPNDEDGKAFIADLCKYVNRDRYRLRVRGQYLKPGNDWRRYQMGQPLGKSKCLRVYVEEKV